MTDARRLTADYPSPPVIVPLAVLGDYLAERALRIVRHYYTGRELVVEVEDISTDMEADHATDPNPARPQTTLAPHATRPDDVAGGAGGAAHPPAGVGAGDDPARSGAPVCAAGTTL